MAESTLPKNNEELFDRFNAKLVEDGESKEGAAAVVEDVKQQCREESLRTPEAIRNELDHLKLKRGDRRLLSSILGLDKQPKNDENGKVSGNKQPKNDDEEAWQKEVEKGKGNKKAKDDDDEDGRGSDGGGSVSDKKASKMSWKDLIAAYDYRDASNPVGDRLRRESSGQAFLIFEENGDTRVGDSLKLLRELKNGEPPRENYLVNDRPVKVYAVGERPKVDAAEVNPLFKGQFLRSDGTCDITGRKWTKKATSPVRTLLMLAVNDTQELTVTDKKSAGDLIKLAHSDDAEKEIRLLCTKASTMYDELEKVDALPKLRMPRPQKSDQGQGGGNPGGGHGGYGGGGAQGGGGGYPNTVRY